MEDLRNFGEFERWSVNGRWLSKGTEATISGVRGRCRFIRAVVNDRGTFLDFYDRLGHWRTFRPERVKTVHVKRKMRY